jgi:hypothetical protein
MTVNKNKKNSHYYLGKIISIRNQEFIIAPVLDSNNNSILRIPILCVEMENEKNIYPSGRNRQVYLPIIGRSPFLPLYPPLPLSPLISLYRTVMYTSFPV